MTEDLSRYHHPITDLFSRQSQSHGLTEDQVRFYQENGYLAGVKVLNDEQLDVLRGELAELIDPAHPGHELFYEFHANESADPSQVLFHALGAWRIKPALHDLLWHPAFVVPAAQLLGGSVRFWHDQIFYKPARHGGVVIWHQDYSYWTRTTPVAHISCWIGLDDSTQANGCLHYVPGSHHWPLLPRASFANEMDAILDSLAPELRAEFKPVPIELKAGECSFHHPMMVHGSYANETAVPRRALVINAFRDGVTSASDEPLLEGVPVIASGQKIEGQFFPLLYEPQS
ncbi:MAG TPA: phytanoyl-CoA dioxygenase family protein [Pyrinomonadaceae bacterium]|nr:phytanoyl-CoA dioxygenase family protein [Pyrinomonadaceae bacterium]